VDPPPQILTQRHKDTEGRGKKVHGLHGLTRKEEREKSRRKKKHNFSKERGGFLSDYHTQSPKGMIKEIYHEPHKQTRTSD